MAEEHSDDYKSDYEMPNEKDWKVEIESGSQAEFTNSKRGTITCFVREEENGVLYALTAGHCVQKGNRCKMNGEDFGECILSYDGLVKENKRVKDNDAGGISVDVALIEVSQKIQFDFMEFFYFGRDKKTDVCVKDPTEDDTVRLYQPKRKHPPPELKVSKFKPAKQPEKNNQIKSKEKSTRYYKDIFILKNPVDGEGSGIVGGDSGSCVVQDAGPGKVNVYGMVVAVNETGDIEKAEAITIVTSNDNDAERNNSKSLGIAIPMSRILAFLSDELGGTQLVLRGMVPPIPLVEALVGEEENQQREHVPTTVPRRKMHNLTDTC